MWRGPDRRRCSVRGTCPPFAFAIRNPMTSNVAPPGPSFGRSNHVHHDVVGWSGSDPGKAHATSEAAHMTIAERYSSSLTTAERLAGGREFVARDEDSFGHDSPSMQVITSAEFLSRTSTLARSEGHVRADASDGAEPRDSTGSGPATHKGHGSRATATHTLVPEGGWPEVLTDATVNGGFAAGPVWAASRNPVLTGLAFAGPFAQSIIQNVDLEQTYVPPEPDMSGGRDSPRPAGGGSDTSPPPSQAASGSGTGPDGAVPPPSQAASGSGMGPDGATSNGSGRGSSTGTSDSDGSQSDGPGSESSSDSASGSGGGTSQAASGSGMGPDGAAAP